MSLPRCPTCACSTCKATPSCAKSSTTGAASLGAARISPTWTTAPSFRTSAADAMPGSKRRVARGAAGGLTQRMLCLDEPVGLGADNNLEAAQEAEREELKMIRQEKRDREEANFRAFEKMVRDGLEKKRQKELAAAGAADVEATPEKENVQQNPSGDPILDMPESEAARSHREQREERYLNGDSGAPGGHSEPLDERTDADRIAELLEQEQQRSTEELATLSTEGEDRVELAAPLSMAPMPAPMPAAMSAPPAAPLSMAPMPPGAVGEAHETEALRSNEPPAHAVGARSDLRTVAAEERLSGKVHGGPIAEEALPPGAGEDDGSAGEALVESVDSSLVSPATAEEPRQATKAVGFEASGNAGKAAESAGTPITAPTAPEEDDCDKEFAELD
eukprot:scaffold1642_cov252-Pinguiococcus_pyrenoidosus.AAC.20